MKNNTNKKILSFILVLLFFITIITAVNAADDTNTTKNMISDDSSTSNLKSDDVVAVSDNNIKNSNMKDDKISTKEITKQNKKESTVNSFYELYDKIEDIKANSNEQSETINLNPGNYNITKTIKWGNITQNTKILTINGNNQTLDGAKKYQFITVAKDYTLNLANITINNCSATNGSVIYNNGTVKIENSNFIENMATSKRYNYECNGGVNYNNGNITITGSNFTGNKAALDGGVNYNDYGSILIMNNSNFTNNTAESGSGGVNSNDFSNLTITGSNFINNTAVYGNGGVNENNNANIIITTSNFTHNTAVYGGVNFNYECNLTITGSNFTANNATEGGVNYNGNSCNLTITGSNFTANNATSGGGVNYNYGNLNITNSSFSNNTADQTGGVIYDDGNLTIKDSNFTDNTALSGGVLGHLSSDLLYIENSIFMNNYDNLKASIYIKKQNSATIKNSIISNKITTTDIVNVELISPIIIEDLNTAEVVNFTENGVVINSTTINNKIIGVNQTFESRGTKTVNLNYPSVEGNTINLVVNIEKVDTRSLADKTINPIEIKTMENANVNIEFNDEMGKDLIGTIPVEVYVNGNSVLNTNIIDGVLKCEIPTENLPAGEYSVEFKVAESENYNTKTFTSTLKIVKRNATMTIKTNTTKVLNTLTINVTLNNENMTINGGNVVFKINNKVIRDMNGNPIKVQLKDNKAQLNYTLPQEIGRGKII